jgi:hypothetical protein
MDKWEVDTPVSYNKRPMGNINLPKFYKTDSALYYIFFHIKLNFSGAVVLRRIFKDFVLHIETHVKVILSDCGPTRHPGAMIFTNLNLHHVR